MKSAITDLEQQIQTLQSRLNGLKKQEEQRQKRLLKLTERRDRLHAALTEIEAQIQAQKAAEAALSLELPTLPDTFSADDQPRLADLILDILRRAGGILSTRAITEEAQRRGYQSKSDNFHKLVEGRIQILKNQNLLQRSADNKGYHLAAVARPEPPRKSAANSDSSSAPQLDMTFSELLTSILSRSRVPLSARELARRALKAGWQTRSKDLRDVVWVTLGKMDNVVRVSRGGYVLKSKADRFTSNSQAANGTNPDSAS